VVHTVFVVFLVAGCSDSDKPPTSPSGTDANTDHAPADGESDLCTPNCTDGECHLDGCRGQCPCPEGKECEEIDKGMFVCLDTCQTACEGRCGSVEVYSPIVICDCSCDDSNPCTDDECFIPTADPNAPPDRESCFPLGCTCTFTANDDNACGDGDPDTSATCLNGTCVVD
jgi:hypothetical protein